MDPTLGDPPGCTNVKARLVVPGDVVVDGWGKEHVVLRTWEQHGFPNITAAYNDYIVDFVLVESGGGRNTWSAPRDQDWELWVRELTNVDELRLSSMTKLTEIKESE